MSAPRDLDAPWPSGPIVGLLMANGRGRRMGTDKRLLPWPPSPADAANGPAIDSPAACASDTPRGAPHTTVIAAAFDSIAPCCTRLFVAAEPSDTIRTALAGREFEFVPGDAGEELGTSIAVALTALIATFRSVTPTWALLLHLADHPAVAPATVERLLAAFASDSSRIVTPRLSDRAKRAASSTVRSSGHPIIIPGELIPNILSYLCATPPPAEGLRGYLRHPATPRVAVPVDDMGIAHNLDTPEDYRGATHPTIR